MFMSLQSSVSLSWCSLYPAFYPLLSDCSTIPSVKYLILRIFLGYFTWYLSIPISNIPPTNLSYTGYICSVSWGVGIKFNNSKQINKIFHTNELINKEQYFPSRQWLYAIECLNGWKRDPSKSINLIYVVCE